LRHLALRAERALRHLQGVRKDRIEKLFRRIGYITPDQLQVTNYPRRPLAAFNPGAALLDDKVLVFPRLVFDYRSYTSSVGMFEVPVEDLLEPLTGRKFPTTIVLWPQRAWEVDRGCEDPRVSLKPNGFRILYTGVGRLEDGDCSSSQAVLAFAELDREFRLERKGFFRVLSGEGKFVPENKDSALIEAHGEQATVLTRPMGLGNAPDMCWRAEADLGKLVIHEETLEPILAPEPWEYKVGWSTNVVQLSEDEYLVGWHGVLKEDLSYRDGLALVNRNGELLAISDYLLAPKGLCEEYGDRALVIFGDGLLLYKETLIWIGGVSDYSIGVFTAKLSDVLPMLRRI